MVQWWNTPYEYILLSKKEGLYPDTHNLKGLKGTMQKEEPTTKGHMMPASIHMTFFSYKL